MATNVYITGLSRAGFRVPNASGALTKVSSTTTGTNVQVNLDDEATQLILAGEKDNFIRVGSNNATTVTIIGLDRTGFRIKNNGGSYVVVKTDGNVTTINLADYKACRQLRRNWGRWMRATSATAVAIRGIQAQQNGFKVYVDATDVLTSDNVNVANASTVTIGSTTYTFKTNLTEAFATDTVGASGVPADGNTVVVNGRTYTFKTALTPTAGEVLINGQDGSLTNLQHAINQSGGVVGTDYVTGAANADVTAGAVGTHAITLTAKVVGTGGNALTLTKVGANLSVGGATFSGGVNPIANEVHIGGDADTSLTNLSEAINAGANIGVDYSSTTVANADVSSSTVSAHALTLTALTPDTTSLTTATTSSHLSFAFTGGVATVYRGQSVTIDATSQFNRRELRRHVRRWIEA